MNQLTGRFNFNATGQTPQPQVISRTLTGQDQSMVSRAMALRGGTVGQPVINTNPQANQNHQQNMAAFANGGANPAQPQQPAPPMFADVPGVGRVQLVPVNQQGQPINQNFGNGQQGHNFATVGPYDQTMGNRSPVLEDWAKMLVNNEYVQDFVAPVVRVNGDVVDVMFFAENNAFQVRKTTGSRASTPRMRTIEHNFERTTLDEIFIERTFIPNGSQRGSLSMGQAATNTLVNDIKLTLEYFVSQKVFNQANYAAGRKSSPGTKWGNPAATPFSDVFNQVIKVVGNTSRFILFGEDAWQKFSVHQEVIDKVHGSIGGIVSPEQVANKLGVAGIKIGRAKYIDGGVMNDVWGDHVLIFARKPTDEAYITGVDASAFYQYRTDTPEIIVNEWPTMDLGLGGNYYQAAIVNKFVKTGSDFLSFLLYDVVA